MKMSWCNLQVNWQDEDLDDILHKIKPGVKKENLEIVLEQAAMKIQAEARGMLARRSVRSSSFFLFLMLSCVSPYVGYVLRHSTINAGHTTGKQTH
jgi:hypothetical protein